MLGIELPYLLAFMINFGLLLTLLTFVLYKPITKTLDERAAKIKESLEKAEQIKQESGRAEAEVRTSLLYLDAGLIPSENIQPPVSESIQMPAAEVGPIRSGRLFYIDVHITSSGTRALSMHLPHRRYYRCCRSVISSHMMKPAVA